MSATDFGDVVAAAGLAAPSTMVLVAGEDESPVPSIAMNAPSARAAPIAAEAMSGTARDAFFMGRLLGRCGRATAGRVVVPVEVQLGAPCELAENQHARRPGWTTSDEEGTVEIDDAPGWRYLPFEGSGEEIGVTVVRDSDGCRLRFTVPAVVQRGTELGQIARIVIAAQE